MNGFVGFITFILILSVPGILYNNANNTGLVVNPGTIGNCDNNLDICNITNNVGCQANAANCQIGSANSVLAVFNKQSPWTYLFTGDVIGFATSWFSQGGSSEFGQPTQLVTFVGNGSASVPSSFNICPAPLKGTSGVGATYSRIHYATGSGGFGGGHTSTVNQVQCNHVTYGVAQGFFYYPIILTFLYWDGNIVNNMTGTIHNATATNTNIVFGASNHAISAQGYAASCFLYGNSTDIQDIVCSHFSSPQTTAGLSTSTLTVNFFNFLTLVGGVVLLWLSLGIGGSMNILTNGISFFDNDQGTKQAQVLGVGLISYSFFTSEFSIWTGLIPYGIGSFLAIVITAGIFYSLFQMIRSLE